MSPARGPAVDLAAVVGSFAVDGDFLRAEPYGNGHIHDTYRVFLAPSGTPARAASIILQRINTQVFRNPGVLMENIARVTAHLAAQVSGHPDRDRRTLALIASRTGDALLQNREKNDQEKNLWRAWRFIENAFYLNQIETPKQAFEAARAFGLFQQQLATLPAPRLHDTIPDFHHTPKRYSAFEEAVARDAAGRVRAAQAEIAFARARQSIVGLLVNAGLPERVTHNDTKCNNVLFDNDSGEAICVIDLDTVMPGLAAYDFGDMVRTMTCPAAEDETDLTRVRVDLALFEAVARGYLSSAGSFLTREEKASLVIAGKLITFELALRFLTDYLNGDTYFKIHRENHNLDRARAQFALVASLEENEVEIARLLRSIKS
jgi:thiamine kinase-like enzyme